MFFLGWRIIRKYQNKLAELNVDRYSAWKQPFSRRNARPIQIWVPEAPGAWATVVQLS